MSKTLPIGQSMGLSRIVERVGEAADLGTYSGYCLSKRQIARLRESCKISKSLPLPAPLLMDLRQRIRAAVEAKAQILTTTGRAILGESIVHQRFDATVAGTGNCATKTFWRRSSCHS